MENHRDTETDTDHRNDKIIAALICIKSFMVKYNLLQMRFPQRKYHFTFRLIIKMKRCYGTNEVSNSVSHYITDGFQVLVRSEAFGGELVAHFEALDGRSCEARSINLGGID